MIASISDLILFLKRFHRRRLDDPALDPASIPTDLPDSLAAIYRELGALVELDTYPPPFATQDCLVALSRLKRVNGMIEFAWENQGNWSARCASGQSNPPVYSDAADSWEEERRGFVVVCDSLAHFLTTLCLQEAVMSCRSLVAPDTNQPPDRVLRVPLQPLWLDGRYVIDEPDHQFFVSHDGDVLIMEHQGLWVGSPVHEVAELVMPHVRMQDLR